MSYTSTARHYIECGIEALNGLKPDWINSIPHDLRELDAMDPNKCPLFYVYGSFMTGVYAFTDADLDVADYGFATPQEWDKLPHEEAKKAWQTLSQEWCNAIEELRD